VAGTEGEIDGLEGFMGEQGETFRGDLEDGFALEFSGADVVFGEQSVAGGIWAEGERLLVNEGFLRHAASIVSGPGASSG
jgi:hypothetical protein